LEQDNAVKRLLRHQAKLRIISPSEAQEHVVARSE
jgi:hypothetical protein